MHRSGPWRQKGQGGRDWSEVFVDGGLAHVWTCLDERYPVKQIMSRKGEALDHVFKVRPLKSESAAGYIGRARGVFTRARSFARSRRVSPQAAARARWRQARWFALPSWT